MIAYVFWHRPAPGAAAGRYEEACARFHAGLAAHRPGGLIGSACLRAPALPWLAGGGAGYEDWYVLEDFGALGVLNEAAVGRGHASSHDGAAKLMGEGTGSIYRLLDGGAAPQRAGVAVWIAPAGGHDASRFEDFLADGIDRADAGLWRRQLALGPAPELCLLAPQVPDGVHETRLPAGWAVEAVGREAVSYTAR